MNENLQIKCLCCNSAKIDKILKLVDSPLTDLYSPSLDISLKKKNYPLELYYCSECSHLQLGIQVPPEESYTKYLYNSKVTPGLKSSFLEYAKTLLSLRKDQRSIDIGNKNGVDISNFKARQFSKEDFKNFDHIYVMDNSNYKDVINQAESIEDEKKVNLILPSNQEVPDPYYLGEKGFEHCYRLLDNACENILKELNL